MYEKYKSENPNVQVSLSQYKRIFYDNFNLHFKPLKTDTCNYYDNARLKDELEKIKINELKQ